MTQENVKVYFGTRTDSIPKINSQLLSCTTGLGVSIEYMSMSITTKGCAECIMCSCALCLCMYVFVIRWA